MKRLVSILLVICVSVSLLSGVTFPASAATSGTCGENVTWTFEDGTLTISGTGAMKNYSHNFSISGTGWAPWMWSHRNSIRTVIIEDGITTIGSYMFDDCDNLSSVTIPDSVTEIGSGAFQYCSSLKELTIPDSVTTIKNNAVFNCPSLTKVHLGNSVSNIQRFAFGACFDLAEINFPESLTTIGEYAFHTTALTSVTIPNGVDTIQERAFSDCTALTSVLLPETLATIESYAFYGCDALPSLVIPASVSSLSTSAVAACDMLTSITVDPANPYYTSYDGDVYNDDMTELIRFAPGKSSTNLRNSVTTIGASSFENSPALQTVILPNSVTTIGEYAFCYCLALASVSLPETLTSISDSAFYNCVALSSVAFPETLVSIGNNAFYQCTALTSIVFPDSLTSIGQYAFAHCEGLEEVTYGDRITATGYGAYCDCSSLHTVNFGESITTIGSYSFQNCDALREIVIPNTVKRLNPGAFYDCDGLTSLSIPETVTLIDGSAFYDCDGLTCVSIPASVTAINKGAFFECTALTDVYFGGDEFCLYGNKEANVFPATCKVHYRQESVINKTGRGYAQFTLRDSEGKPYANRTVEYTIVGEDTLWSVTTNENGVVTVQTEELTLSGDTAETRSFTVIFSNGDLKKRSFQFDVTITPPEYQQTWKGALMFGAAAKLEGGLLDLGISGKHERSFAMEEIIRNGTRDLRLATAADRAVAASSEIGLDAGPITVAELKGEIGIQDTLGRGCYIENYDPENVSQRKQIELFLLDTALGLGSSKINVISQKILEFWAQKNGDATFNEENTSFGIQTETGVEVGKLELGGVEADVFGFSGGGVLSYARSKSHENVKTVSAKTEAVAGMKLLDFSVGGEVGAGKTNIGAGTSVAARDVVHNSIEFSVTGGTYPSEIRYSTAEEYLGAIMGVSSCTQYFRDIYYTGEAAQSLASSNNFIYRLAQDKLTFFTPDSAHEISELMIGSEYTAQMDRVKEHANAFSYTFVIGPSEDLALKFGVSGEHSYSYTKETGIIQDQTEYVKSVNELDAEITQNRSRFDDVFAPIIAGISEDIRSMFSSNEGNIKEGFTWRKTKVSGEKDWKVHVSTFNQETVSLQAVSIMSLDTETEIESVSTTVGEPYVISVIDTDGNAVSEFGEEGLDLTLYFDEGDFANSGISYTEEMIEQLKIYRWDEEKEVYLVEDSMVDTVNGCVTAKIYQPGQYILAIDNTAPEISEFMISSQSRTPTISAVISDLSGLSDFHFTLDGIELVNEGTFAEYFNEETGVFTYRVANPLLCGDHVATISVADSTGNASGKVELEFSIQSDLSISTVDGAQIRTTGKQGLRFISSIDKSAVDFARVVEYGTLLIPSDDVSDISEVVIGAKLNGHSVAKVRADKIYEQTDTTIKFTAVLIGVPVSQYKRTITARAYAILDNGEVIYGDTYTSRSIYQVAQLGLENPNESEENKVVFYEIICTTDGENFFDYPW